MSGVKHTPAPWAFEIVPEDGERSLPASEWSGLFIGPMDEETGRPFRTIFEGAFTHGKDDGDAIADARLIAAAPELLSAAKEVLDWMNRLPIPTEGCTAKGQLLHDAIAKATGGTNA